MLPASGVLAAALLGILVASSNARWSEAARQGSAAAANPDGAISVGSHDLYQLQPPDFLVIGEQDLGHHHAAREGHLRCFCDSSTVLRHRGGLGGRAARRSMRAFARRQRREQAGSCSRSALGNMSPFA